MILHDYGLVIIERVNHDITDLLVDHIILFENQVSP